MVLPELLKGSESYDIEVTQGLQKKIDYLCSKMSTVEWSGTLFYRVEGDFNNTDNNRLKVIAFDLFLQDIGSSTYTAYYTSPSLVSYMCEYPELLEEDVFMGLIHSHNTMPTFFSGTDTSTLQKEGYEKDNFVSLIVNNYRSYTAGITSKCTRNSTIKKLSMYKTFFNKIIEVETEEEVVVDVIEWYDLEVHMFDDFGYEGLDECIKEIKAEKVAKVKTYPAYTRPLPTYKGTASPTFPPKNDSYGFGVDTNINDVPPLAFDKWDDDDDDPDGWGEAYIEKPVYVTIASDPEVVDSYEGMEYSPEKVEELARQLLSGSVLVAKNEKLDLDKFVSTSDKLFNNRFDSDKEFQTWAEMHIDYLLSETSEYGENEDPMDNMGLYAFALTERLSLLPKSRYVNLFIDIIEAYI